MGVRNSEFSAELFMESEIRNSLLSSLWGSEIWNLFCTLYGVRNSESLLNSLWGVRNSEFSGSAFYGGQKFGILC